MKRQISGVLVLMVGFCQPVWSGGSVDVGRSLFSENCVVCHGSPPDFRASRGANSPATIRAQLRTNPQMMFLSGLTDQQVTDIAAFIGNPSANDSDRLFDWAEGQYASLLTPKTQSQTLAGYYARAYTGTNVYVGTKDGRLFFLNGGTGALLDLGGVADFARANLP